jgi:hypothetical protein
MTCVQIFNAGRVRRADWPLTVIPFCCQQLKGKNSSTKCDPGYGHDLNQPQPALSRLTSSKRVAKKVWPSQHHHMTHKPKVNTAAPPQS